MTKLTEKENPSLRTGKLYYEKRANILKIPTGD